MYTPRRILTHLRHTDALDIHFLLTQNTIESYTYADLHARVERFAGVLRDQGVEKGDVVLIYMPMIPQAVVAMLACARYVS